jgi:hypothetical protein
MKTFSALLILFLLTIAGCGGSSTVPPVIYITISPLNASVPIGNTLQFSETTSGSATTDVAWQVNGIAGGNSTYGTISATGLYTAPATVPDPGTVVVTVVSLANTTYIANANVTIVSGIAVAVSPATANLGLGQTQQFMAAVTGNANAGVVWKAGGVTGGNAASGTITAGGLYTAPATATTPLGVTITATSVVDPSKSGTATVTVHGGVAVSLEPNPVTVLTNHTVQFVPAISGSANTGLTWQVNGINGGGPSIGTISAGGLYLAPLSVPTEAVNGTSQIAAVTVTAISQADASASASVVVTIVSPNQSAETPPISLGVSGGNALDSATGGCCGGTLGALVSRGGNYYILGSNHVLARTDQGSPGEAILQPGLMDSNCASEGAATVANLSQFSSLENPAPGTPAVDAAMALVRPGQVKLSGSILELGDSLLEGQPADGSPHAGSGVSAAFGQAVAKSGRSTGLTCAAISAIHLTANVVFKRSCGSDATFTATLEDLVVVGGGSFSAEGDSGSLVVTQDTADPVALIVGGSDTDTIAQPVAQVLEALRDPSSGEAPVFVGSLSPHPVAACTLPQFQTAAGIAPSSPASIALESLELAASVRDARGAELAESYGLDAVGIGPSLDQPGEAAILLFVSGARQPAEIPQTVDGIRTRLVRLSRVPASLVASAAESAALLENATGAVMSVGSASLARAVAAGKAAARSLLAGQGIEAVGVGASADSPGEAALAVYVARAKPHASVPAVVGSVRTQIRETNGFRAGSSGFRPRSGCQAKTGKKQLP